MMYKKIICLLSILIIFLGFVGCDLEPIERAEQPHLYWKDIDVVVENVEKQHWFATTHRYQLSITVYNQEYNLRKTIDSSSSGMFTPQHWNIEQGDIIKAQLYSWVIDSTGEVVKREIHSLK